MRMCAVYMRVEAAGRVVVNEFASVHNRKRWGRSVPHSVGFWVCVGCACSRLIVA